MLKNAYTLSLYLQTLSSLERWLQCHNTHLEVKVVVKETLLEMSFQCLMKILFIQTCTLFIKIEIKQLGTIIILIFYIIAQNNLLFFQWQHVKTGVEIKKTIRSSWLDAYKTFTLKKTRQITGLWRREGSAFVFGHNGGFAARSNLLWND